MGVLLKEGGLCGSANCASEEECVWRGACAKWCASDVVVWKGWEGVSLGEGRGDACEQV